MPIAVAALSPRTYTVHHLTSSTPRLAPCMQISALLQIHGKVKAKHADEAGASERLQSLAQAKSAGASSSALNKSLALHRKEQYHTLQEDEGVAEAQMQMLHRSTADQVRAGLTRFHTLRLEDASELVMHLQVPTHAVLFLTPPRSCSPSCCNMARRHRRSRPVTR